MTSTDGVKHGVNRPGASFLDDARERIRTRRGNFQFNTVSALALAVIMGLGLSLQSVIGSMPTPEQTAQIVAAVLAGAVLLFLVPYWPVVIACIAAVWAALPVAFDENLTTLAAALTVAFLLAPGFEVISQWDKAVVLRLGRFRRIAGPGLILLVPLVESVAGYIDTRIRATDFRAEQCLTRDTVPVHVDAVAFWMIWDPQKSILEVENFLEAVVLSAQTALRDSVGAHDLSTLLSERVRLGTQIQGIVDAKTNPWGITILSVELKEIIVPDDLHDSLSKVAQASREHDARVILGKAEAAVAEHYAQAAAHYAGKPEAVQLRGMAMIYEGIRKHGGLVMIPTEALQSMNIGTVLGSVAYAQKPSEVDDPSGDDATQPG